jgi:hypothetical protein
MKASVLRAPASCGRISEGPGVNAQKGGFSLSPRKEVGVYGSNSLGNLTWTWMSALACYRQVKFEMPRSLRTTRLCVLMSSRMRWEGGQFLSPSGIARRVGFLRSFTQLLA